MLTQKNKRMYTLGFFSTPFDTENKGPFFYLYFITFVKNVIVKKELQVGSSRDQVPVLQLTGSRYF